jgi:hypothetical protein
MRLNKATFLSVFVAAVVLITIVLPAEFELDPLGTPIRWSRSRLLTGTRR